MGEVKENKVTCFVCGKEFELSSSRIKRSASGIFTCSKECLDVRRKTPNVECAYCGKKFHLKPYRIKKAKKNYCSNECNWNDRKERYLGENNHQYGLKGDLNGSHISDISLSNYGYLMVLDYNHPFRMKQGYMFIHRLVIEEYLRENEPDSEFLVKVDGYDNLFLSPDVIVHHKNKIKTDNRVENLEIMSRGDHSAYHCNLNKDKIVRSEKTGRFKCINVKGEYKKIDNGVKTLFKKHSQDAGLDIASTVDTVIPANSYGMVKTGIYAAIPENHVGLLWSRSGLAVKHGIEVGAGCIDASYRGEIIVKLYNMSDKDFEIKTGDRIAQLLTIPINIDLYEEVDTLDETERGSGGFGHTGV